MKNVPSFVMVGVGSMGAINSVFREKIKMCVLFLSEFERI